MGASNEKPVKCPLCHEDCRNQVTLTCKHSFCQRCIGEIWSVSPTGPYYCPECKYEYKHLPDYTDGASTSTATPNANWTLGRNMSARYSPKTLSKTLLGKRKSSSAFPEKYHGGYRLGSAPSKKTKATGSDVIDVIDSDDDTTALRKRRATADEHPRGNQSSSSMSDTSTQCTPPETTQITPPRVKSFPESNSASVTPDQPVMASCSDEGTPRKSTTPREPPTPKNTSGEQTRVSPSNSDENLSANVSDRSREGTPRINSIPCHYCPSSDQKVAVKTCLVCGASMCSKHLRAHLEKPVFKNHPLVSAVEDVSLWRCQDHQEMNRIYCRTCRVCVCTVCSLVGAHKGHECISIREAEQELRGSLNNEMKKMQKTEKSIQEKVSEINERKHSVKTGLEEVRAAVLQQYQAMREALQQEEEQALHCMAQEENRVLGSIQNQLETLQNALMSSGSILNTLQALSDARGMSQYQDQAFIMEYTKIGAQLSGLSDPVQNLNPLQEVNQGRLDCLQDWTERRLDTVLITLPHRDPYRLLHGISPHLDLDTAHPKLLLSDDNRTVQYTETQQDYTDQETRFNIFPQILGSHALDEGRYYWEVEVPMDEGRWKVGVCDGQIGRKGQKDACRIGFYPNSWCLIYEKGKVEALHDKVASPVCATGLWKVGMLLDFNEGRLSFYSVAEEGALSLLYSFEHSFTEPLYLALAVSKTQLRICDVFTKPTTD
ncbi:E3 ubiquitin/ISG15 ligase TRIM25 [Triplophysa rosa]|uniref:E3 ubiquitin/ISG15 ligase TRIM25 n=1 Tax=Triplophysa rosa TaxID=992332 RepID=A0A9W7TUH9_TRIRA|nr:E3 ubiquitin/ISG15 ligase TRIM25 [Triplophysa rosa]KAI7802733.1 putative E3 ubiquitin/ISG15 ligase TRIM25 [Triplophysa rosa]